MVGPGAVAEVATHWPWVETGGRDRPNGWRVFGLFRVCRNAGFPATSDLPDLKRKNPSRNTGAKVFQRKYDEVTTRYRGPTGSNVGS